MIITFFGHSGFIGTKEYEEKLLSFLEKNIGENTVQMYLGGYGGFDEFAYSCCKKYKENHPKASLIFVTPYITLEYQKNHLDRLKSLYDIILYPEIEDKPKRFAIYYRNKFMVESADFVITYVVHSYGGAYTAYKIAKRRGKNIFNLGKANE
ncbi:MAG: hypothetical protein J6C39_04305, partial [Clostridia bacterium]|nr:hypothetical protein [Clostridia bacterium]MBO5315681.1 hypothetical protein [Clostridia bacterium]